MHPYFDSIGPYIDDSNDQIKSLLNQINITNIKEIKTVSRILHNVYLISTENNTLILKLIKTGNRNEDYFIEAIEYQKKLHCDFPNNITSIYNQNNMSLHGYFKGMYFVIFEYIDGVQPNIFTKKMVNEVENLIEKIKNGKKLFKSRVTHSFCDTIIYPLQIIINDPYLPIKSRAHWANIHDVFVENKKSIISRLFPQKMFMTHADISYKNIIWRNNIPVLIDFDDCANTFGNIDYGFYCDLKNKREALGYSKKNNIHDIYHEVNCYSIIGNIRYFVMCRHLSRCNDPDRSRCGTYFIKTINYYVKNNFNYIAKLFQTL
jgi:Ser/Thr protein kinase RdoA (MazF antagonist)